MKKGSKQGEKKHNFRNYEQSKTCSKLFVVLKGINAHVLPFKN
jgi:hypothetical protein